MNNKITIFDTTLRDGDQAPECRFSRKGKLVMARQLINLGVDVIEAGYAASSDNEHDIIKEIAERFGTKEGPVICSLCRTTENDILQAIDAVKPAYHNRIHTFIATSDIHIKDKFRKDRAWVLETTDKMVRFARENMNKGEIEFCCEDFGRTSPDFAVNVCETALKAGASIINLADTTGYFLPEECKKNVGYVIHSLNNRGYFPIFSVHNHNDLGLATSNTIAGIQAGAKQVHVTVNGIGERAGNTALEEVVMSMNTKSIGECNINTPLIKITSNLCSRCIGWYPAKNKPIVGKNAFAHEAGIHAASILRNPETYQIINPDSVGCKIEIVIGARSGSGSLNWKYQQLGLFFDDSALKMIYKDFKKFCDNHRYVRDSDLLDLASKYK